MPDAPNRIREYRQAAGLSQESLGVKVGVSHVMVGLMERGRRDGTQRTRHALSAALSAPYVDVFPPEQEAEFFGFADGPAEPVAA